MSNSNAVIVKCKYCGREFTTDARHPHATCCGSLECRRAAARYYAKRHYQTLKTLYASREERSDPYHRMLDRKKAERRKRLLSSTAAEASSAPPPPRNLPPRIRLVSMELLCTVLEMVFGFINATADPDENRHCLLVNLERASLLHDCPAHQTEMRNLIELFHAHFPHICPSAHGGAPQVCSTHPS